MSHHSPAAASIYDSILQTIGNTPLVRLDRFADEKRR